MAEPAQVKRNKAAFHRKLKKLGFASYRDYLASEHWQKLRRRYRRNRPWECFICGRVDRLALHHLTYDRLGYERLSDLRPTCEVHHERIHKLANEQAKTIKSASQSVEARAQNAKTAPMDNWKAQFETAHSKPLPPPKPQAKSRFKPKRHPVTHPPQLPPLEIDPEDVRKFGKGQARNYARERAKRIAAGKPARP